MRTVSSCFFLITALCLGQAAMALDVPFGGIGFRNDGSGVYPNAKPPTTLNMKKALRWKIAPANWGYGCPVEVGDQVLVMCEPNSTEVIWPTLVSYDVKTGTENWRCEVSPVTAKGITGAKKKQIDEAHATWNATWEFAYTHFRAYPKADAAKRKKILETLAKRQITMVAGKEWRAGWGNLRAARIKDPAYLEAQDTLRPFQVYRYAWHNYHNERVGTCYSTPVSDGKSVFVMTVHGVAACIDLSGKLRWSVFTGWKLPGNSGLGTHPRLADGKMICCFGTQTIAVDMKTGKESWRVGENTGVAHGVYTSPVVFDLDGTVVVVDGRARVIRVADGKILKDDIGHKGYPCYVPVHGENSLFFLKDKKSILGLSLRMEGDTLKTTPLGKPIADTYRASPVYVDGFIFQAGKRYDTRSGTVSGGRKKGKAYAKWEERAATGAKSPPTRQLTLYANGHLYGHGDFSGGKASLKRGSAISVFKTDGSFVSVCILPDLKDSDPNVQKVTKQGIFPEGKFYNMACPLALGQSSVYARDNAYLYCFGK